MESVNGIFFNKPLSGQISQLFKEVRRLSGLVTSIIKNGGNSGGGNGGNFDDSHLIPKSYFPYTSPQDTGYVWVNGVAIATHNLGAPGQFVENIEDTGMFYQWNRLNGWSAVDPLIDSDGNTVWNPSNSGTTNQIWNDLTICPPGFRFPTAAEMVLISLAETEWDVINGVNGRWYGEGSHRVFIPAAGQRQNSDGALIQAGLTGNYWTGTGGLSSAANSFVFTVNNPGSVLGGTARSRAHSIRLVAIDPIPADGNPYGKLAADISIEEDGGNKYLVEKANYFDNDGNIQQTKKKMPLSTPEISTITGGEVRTFTTLSVFTPVTGVHFSSIQFALDEMNWDMTLNVSPVITDVWYNYLGNSFVGYNQVGNQGGWNLRTSPIGMPFPDHGMNPGDVTEATVTFKLHAPRL